jgi:hypothetical protein
MIITPIATLTIVSVVTSIRISGSYNVSIIVPTVFPLLTVITLMA